MPIHRPSIAFCLATLACAVLSLPACSLDSGDAGGAGGTSSGGSSGASGSGGVAGGGGVSVGGVGGSMVPSFDECRLIVAAQSGDQVAFACGFCLCSPPDTRNTVTACDAQCWSLIACVGAVCGINGGQDITCISQNCGEFLGGSSSALPLSPLVQNCQPECGSLLAP